MLTGPKIVSLVPPSQNDSVAIKLTEKYIKELFKAKVLSKLSYVYFGLVIEKQENNESVDIEQFCDRWNVSRFDFLKSVNDLDNKSVFYIHNQPKHIQLTLVFPDSSSPVEEDFGF